MSISVSPGASAADAPSANADDTSTKDGWRNGGLPALRAELDTIDNAIHDLLIRRAEVVEHVARSGKPAAFRPGREASILRRLVDRHQGALPPQTLVRIWREMLAGTTAMQGGFSVIVGDATSGMALAGLAREHFGALTPLRTTASPEAALAEVARGSVPVAILPYPSAAETWWVALRTTTPRLHIIARLPFWGPRPTTAPDFQAVVVAATAPDASECDRSFISLTSDPGVAPPQLEHALTTAGFGAPHVTIAAVQSGHVLAEVAGPVSDDDPRLTHLDPALREPKVLGHYAVPIGVAP
jgi:chorismate mutase / prephenate dehydratase